VVSDIGGVVHVVIFVFVVGVVIHVVVVVSDCVGNVIHIVAIFVV
jgi:hypothetical protein